MAEQLLLIRRATPVDAEASQPVRGLQQGPALRACRPPSIYDDQL